MSYSFDRYLRYDDLTEWLRERTASAPNLARLESYGRSHEGRDLWLVTLTDSSTGPADSKAALWIDANIHSIELTGGVAACRIIDALIEGFGHDSEISGALSTRTFYIAPRVNPDGVEWALADSPTLRRSSTRSWPRPGHRHLPGLRVHDIDGDGRILSLRVPDPDGAWMAAAADRRIMVPVPLQGTPVDVQRFRLFAEGDFVDFDGFSTATVAAPEALDLNRNFPAGWATTITGSGDHPLSEPEIDCLVRAIVARPNVCTYNAFHTSGGFLLRPSSTRPDRELPPLDVWTWQQLGRVGVDATGYSMHSLFDDFTWDPKDTMSGASDDWAYEQLGIFSWTVEFWDVVERATGTKCGPMIWQLGPTEAEELAVLAWSARHGYDMFVDWYPFDHPQLGPVELGGWNTLHSFDNPPVQLLAAEVEPHVRFAVAQALAAPQLQIARMHADRLGDDTWRVTAGIVNTGFLATDISAHARASRLVLPLEAELSGKAVTVIDGPARRELGQLEGRAAARFTRRRDGAGDRVLASWIVQAPEGERITVDVRHPRAGRVDASLTLGRPD